MPVVVGLDHFLPVLPDLLIAEKRRIARVHDGAQIERRAASDDGQLARRGNLLHHRRLRVSLSISHDCRMLHAIRHRQQGPTWIFFLAMVANWKLEIGSCGSSMLIIWCGTPCISVGEILAVPMSRYL